MAFRVYNLEVGIVLPGGIRDVVVVAVVRIRLEECFLPAHGLLLYFSIIFS